jgi:hypothetical protein
MILYLKAGDIFIHTTHTGRGASIRYHLIYLYRTEAGWHSFMDLETGAERRYDVINGYQWEAVI